MADDGRSSYPVLVLPKEVVEVYRELLFKCKLVDKSIGFALVDGSLEIPLVSDITTDQIDAAIHSRTGPEDTPLPLSDVGASVQTRSDERPVVVPIDPAVRVFDRLRELNFPEDTIAGLPMKWELFGDVLVLRLDSPLERQVAAVYAEVLGANTVVVPTGGVEGTLRQPQMRVVHGERTETTHIENRIKFNFDVTRIMYSSGNVDERIRMANVDATGETVIDMFAGIGYFSLPLAVHAGADQVYSLELNPEAFAYLKENIELNRVISKITPVLGDNRHFDPPKKADRLLMGYVGTTHEFLEKGMTLINDKATVHYHETCPVEEMATRPLSRVKVAANNAGFEVISHKWHRIKSYAPGIAHVVADVGLSRS